MKKWKLGFIVLSVSAAFSVQVTYAANPVSQQQVNDLFCNSNLPIPSNLCPTSSPTARNPASQQYVCERYLAVKNQTPSTSDIPVKIGDTVGNGIVYYIDNANQRGLIAAQTDVLSGGGQYPWAAVITSIPLATGKALFTGKTNTDAIIQAGIMGSYGTPAATQARAYSPAACPPTINCDPSYSLPSQGELMLLWAQFKTLGLSGFSSNFYWSSTQGVTTTDAWFVFFGPPLPTPPLPTDGYVDLVAKDINPLRVRPVRCFSYGGGSCP